MNINKLFLLLCIGAISFSCKEVKKSDSEVTEAEAEMSTSMKNEAKDTEITITPIEHATAVLEWNNINFNYRYTW